MKHSFKNSLIAALVASVIFTVLVTITDEEKRPASLVRAIYDVLGLNLVFFGLFLCIFMGLHVTIHKIRHWSR